MTIAEYHDGTFWQTIATQTYVNNLMGLFAHSSYCGFLNNSVVTQNLTANVWVKLVSAGITYFGNDVGVYLNANNTQNGRIVKINNALNSGYIADASVVIRSSSFVGHNINIQIVKNGILSSLLPYNNSTRVIATGTNQKYDVKCHTFALGLNDYVELYVQATVNTTITPTDYILNVETL